MPVIVGGAAAAGIALTVAVIVVVVLRILKKPGKIYIIDNWYILYIYDNITYKW